VVTSLTRSTRSSVVVVPASTTAIASTTSITATHPWSAESARNHAKRLGVHFALVLPIRSALSALLAFERLTADAIKEGLHLVVAGRLWRLLSGFSILTAASVMMFSRRVRVFGFGIRRAIAAQLHALELLLQLDKLFIGLLKVEIAVELQRWRARQRLARTS